MAHQTAAVPAGAVLLLLLAAATLVPAAAQDPCTDAAPQDVHADVTPGGLVEVSWRHDGVCDLEHFLVWKDAGELLVGSVDPRPGGGSYSLVVPPTPTLDPVQFHVQAVPPPAAGGFDAAHATAAPPLDLSPCAGLEDTGAVRGCIQGLASQEPLHAAQAAGAWTTWVGMASLLVLVGAMTVLAFLWRSEPEGRDR